MRTLSIDLETYSGANLATGGVYRYAADDDFDLLLFAYSVDDGPVHVVSTATDELVPDEVVAALTDPAIIKYAFNAQFERVCLSRWLQQRGDLPAGQFIDPAGWRCSMVWCSALGLPRSLKQAAITLGLQAHKIDEGKDLIKFFCVPTTPSKAKVPALFDATGMKHRNLPRAAPEKWLDFIEYNRQDVAVENEMRAKLSRFPLPTDTWRDYATDQRINDNGIRVDITFAEQAIAADAAFRDHCVDEARELTGLDNPASPKQLGEWLADVGVIMPSMSKESVAAALETATGVAKRVLELRQDMSRSSTRKYAAMLDCALPADHRAHGLIQYYGAGRTGRWAGRLIQVQNLPRNYLPDLDEARALVRGGQHDMVEMLYESLPDTLSQLIRTAFIPSEGNKFIVADYSAIEARVLAWLAGQQDTLDAFAAGADIYCSTASSMFGVPVVKHGVNGELRQKGKVAVLACGYQGGVGAIKKMGGERMGLSEPEMQSIVDAWRRANHHIVSYWYAIDEAARHTIDTGEPTTVRSISFAYEGGMLLIGLPSGRYLVYPKASLGVNKFGRESITFYGMDTARRFGPTDTYGGKLVENITQAVARDLLAYALRQLEQAGHKVVMHIHDEAVIDAPEGATVDEVCELMGRTPEWAAGLPVIADGYECNYYMKD